jgi:hypothetical protein
MIMRYGSITQREKRLTVLNKTLSIKLKII